MLIEQIEEVGDINCINHQSFIKTNSAPFSAIIITGVLVSSLGALGMTEAFITLVSLMSFTCSWGLITQKAIIAHFTSRTRMIDLSHVLMNLYGYVLICLKE